MIKQKILIFGTSSLAENLLFYIQNDSTEYEVVAFVKSTAALENKPESEFKGLPVLPFETIESTHPPSEYQMIISIGYHNLNKTREEIFNKAKDKGYTLANYICSSSTQWPDLELGENVIIFDRNILQPFVKIGNGVILSRGNSIGHNSTIKDFSFIANNVTLCGFNEVGERTFLGSSCTIVDDAKIAADNLIGAATFIKNSTNPKEVYATDQSSKLNKKPNSFFNW